MQVNGNELSATFATQGFVFPLDVMTRKEAEKERQRLESFEVQYTRGASQLQCLRTYPHLVLPFVDAIIRNRKITDAVATILGDNLLVLDAAFFIKEPQTQSFVSWHQDLHYWGLNNDEEVTAWIALSPATTESGCMRFVAGSHKNIVEHVDTYHEDNLLSRGQKIDLEVDEHKATDIVLAPGQMSLHHGRLFHSSGRNISNDRRLGLAIRYIPTSMEQSPGSDMFATLVRGKDSFGHFRKCSLQTSKLSKDNFAYWSDIANARQNVILDDDTAPNDNF